MEQLQVSNVIGGQFWLWIDHTSHFTCRNTKRLYKIIRCCFPLFNDCLCIHFGLFNPADVTELPPPSPSSPETSCLYLSLTWPPLKNDTPPIHPWLFLSSPAKPFDPFQTNPFSPNLPLSRHQYFINVQWQMYLNAVVGADAEMDGPIGGGVGGLVSGMVASSFTAYISHTTLLLVEEKGPRR